LRIPPGVHAKPEESLALRPRNVGVHPSHHFEFDVATATALLVNAHDEPSESSIAEMSQRFS
jgi:hypothetical protein